MDRTSVISPSEAVRPQVSQAHEEGKALMAAFIDVVAHHAVGALAPYVPPHMA